MRHTPFFDRSEAEVRCLPFVDHAAMVRSSHPVVEADQEEGGQLAGLAFQIQRLTFCKLWSGSIFTRFLTSFGITFQWVYSKNARSRTTVAMVAPLVVVNQFVAIVSKGWIRKRIRRIFGHGGASPLSLNHRAVDNPIFSTEVPPSSNQPIHQI